MTIKVTAEQLDAIRRQGEQAYPHECCGLLLGKFLDGTKQLADILPISNSREDEARHNRYLISPAEYFQAQRLARGRGLDIIGCYHSHPDHPARPSGFDLNHATFPGESFIIASVANGKAVDLNSFVMTEDRARFDSEDVIES